MASWLAQLPARAGPTLAPLVVLLTLGLAPSTSLRFDDQLVADVPWPTSFTFTSDGRMLVTSQTGELRVVRNGGLVQNPALDLGPRLCSSAERGLLGVAARDSPSPGSVFVFHTVDREGTCANRVSRFTLSASDVVDPASEDVLIDGIPSPHGNHNGGGLAFGDDGLLYVSVGDGGCDYAGDSGCGYDNDAARDPHVLLGKILRITPDGRIPEGNPHQGPDSARCNLTGRTDAGRTCQETFASGLRNPFRMAFDAATPATGGTRFFINDVGQNTWEEIDEGRSGADYGWPTREARCAPRSTTDCGPAPPGLTDPVYDYRHHRGCSATTGGAFVPGQTFGARWAGAYLFSDYSCGKLFALRPTGSGRWERHELASGLGSVVDLGFGPAGGSATNAQALYYATYSGGGQLRRLVPTAAGNLPPTAKLSASAVGGGLDVGFEAGGSGDPDGDRLSYRWDFGDGSAPLETAEGTIDHRYASPRPATAMLRVRDDDGALSAPATVRVVPGNTVPSAEITSPPTGTRFRVGQEVTLSGRATDAEDGSLPDSALRWQVALHHRDHSHPFLAPTEGNGIPIVTPHPEDLTAAATSWLEVRLTATDSAGVSTTAVRELHPNRVALTFTSHPAGSRLEVNGRAFTAPWTLVAWEGWPVELAAPPGSTWSDGGASVHRVVTPATSTTYSATVPASPSGS